jgi:uncharacterized protein YjiS (DUF1127 family)
METAMSRTLVIGRAAEWKSATWPPAIASSWNELRSLVARWSARQRFRRSIAHLDDRLLADAGLGPQDLGLGERLIRHFVAGGDIWAGEKLGLSDKSMDP